MKWLESQAKERGISLRQVGDKIGYHNASRVGLYFRQKIVAGPDMVRRLALAVGVSPIEALWLSEHYSAVFDYLDQLYKLGWAWMREDKVSLQQDIGAHFWPTFEVTTDSGPIEYDPSEAPPSVVHRYHRAVIKNLDGSVFHGVALPKPMASAILLGIGLFPRRGDVQREETRQFVNDLSLMVSSDMIPLSERVRIPVDLSSVRRPLREAEKILPWKVYPSPMRLAVVAEYVHNWCDIVCKGYADFARLATYRAGGFVGAPRKGENIWKYRTAELPSLGDLQLTKRVE